MKQQNNIQTSNRQFRLPPFLKHYELLLFSLITAVIFIGLGSKSSPLYPTNDWVDIHCFLTMGKGLINGLIPYVDLYEQKGPVLYFIYAVVALFSQRNMFGQFLLEIITFGLFLYYSGRIAQLYLGKSKMIYVILPVLSTMIVVCPSFSHGGSVEQTTLFIFAYALYSVLLACHKNRPMTSREAITNGLFAGILLWVKYTMLGFYIGLCVFVLLWYLIWVRDIKALLKTIGQFLLGMGAVTLVVVLFFALVGGLDELFTCYFYNNIFLYTIEDSMPLVEKINLYLSSSLKANPSFYHALIAGLIWLVLRAYKSPRDLLAPVLSFTCMAITTFIGKGYIYYALIFSAFSVFGLIGLARVLQLIRLPQIFAKVIQRHKIVYAILIALSFLPTVQFAYLNGNNLYMLQYGKEDLPSYQFAQIIKETPDAKILNLGFLDGGFYHAADVLPSCKFFCTFNVNAPGMTAEHCESIQQGEVDYVITRHPPSNYEIAYFGTKQAELVATAVFPFEGYDFTYKLYRLN